MDRRIYLTREVKPSTALYSLRQQRICFHLIQPYDSFQTILKKLLLGVLDRKLTATLKQSLARLLDWFQTLPFPHLFLVISRIDLVRTVTSFLWCGTMPTMVIICLFSASRLSGHLQPCGGDPFLLWRIMRRCHSHESGSCGVRLHRDCLFGAFTRTVGQYSTRNESRQRWRYVMIGRWRLFDWQLMR